MDVKVQAGPVTLEGFLTFPEGAKGIVLFAHGSGSSRFSPRNQYVAQVFNEAGLATLLFDLLTPEEEEVDLVTRHIRFDIPLLSERVAGAVAWMKSQTDQKIGVIGSSTGAASALVAAALRPDDVAAVVSRGGRPDLAGEALPKVKAPTLMVVGSHDYTVIELNEQAKAQMTAEVKLELVEGATHLFEEPGTLEKASELARDWFVFHLAETVP